MLGNMATTLKAAAHSSVFTLSLILMAISFTSCGDDKDEPVADDKKPSVTEDTKSLLCSTPWTNGEEAYLFNANGTGEGREMDNYGIPHDSWTFNWRIQGDVVTMVSEYGDVDTFEILSISAKAATIRFEDGSMATFQPCNWTDVNHGDDNEIKSLLCFTPWSDGKEGYLFKTNGNGYGIEFGENGNDDVWTFTYTLKGNIVTMTEEDGDTYDFEILYISKKVAKVLSEGDEITFYPFDWDPYK